MKGVNIILTSSYSNASPSSFNRKAIEQVCGFSYEPSDSEQVSQLCHNEVMVDERELYEEEIY
jgi:hypothetical protein